MFNKAKNAKVGGVNMRSKMLIAFIFFIILSAVTYILFPDSVNAAYNGINPFINKEFSSLGQFGYILAIIHVTIYHEFSYIFLILWLTTGLAAGLLARGGINGFIAGFYMCIAGFVIYYLILATDRILLFITITYTMQYLFTNIIAPLITNGLFSALGGLIGGMIRPPPSIEIPTTVYKKLETLLPIKCPNCGTEIYSSARYCSNCGSELPEVTLEQ